MSGQETFQFAAAVAGVSIGLTAILVLSIVAVVGVWQGLRRAGEASLASARAAVGIEELARHVSSQLVAAARTGTSRPVPREPAGPDEYERRLDELTQRLLDATALEGGPSPAAFEELRNTVARLDANVGQMAANLANFFTREQPYP